MRRNESESTGRPYSRGPLSGGANSARSQSGISFRNRTPVTKKSSVSCRSTVCDQNSIASTYRHNNPAPRKNSSGPKRHRANLKVSGPTKPKPKSNSNAPAKSKNNNRCCRRRKVNNLRQCAANRFGELSKNPFINFFRAYKRKHTDMSLIEVAGRVAKIWNSMTEKQKVKYQLPLGYAPGLSCPHKRGGGGAGTSTGGGGRRRAFGPGTRRPRMRPLHSPKALPKERTPPDLDDVYSDQTVPSSISKSRSRSGSLSE